MKEKIKEFAKQYLIGFVLGVVTAISISVIAATYFPSGDVTYDNTESGLSSTNVQGAIDELYGVCTAEPPAGDQIIEDNGLEKDPYECRYFFTGANPNNYVTFNEETAGWRIISVGCDGTIKIMKDTSIGENIAWDTSNLNNWNRPANLNTYLNGDYYNSLTSTAQSQIIEGTYYAGEVTYNNNDMQEQISDEKTVTSKVKVALPTVSEYIRSNSNSNCKTFRLNNNNYSTCRNTTWMYKSNIAYWWTLSPHSGDSDNVFGVRSDGYVSTSSASYASTAVRPAITLSSEVQITGGIGTESDPYILS